MLLRNSWLAALAEDWETGGFGVYLHWPFCQAKCPYCDFNSHVAQFIDEQRWLAAYRAEIDRYAKLTEGRIVSSVFFGGGTPSLMSPDLVDGILDHMRRAWRMTNDPEITLEANPGSVEAGRFAGYAQAGINRISMGVQALNDRDLKRLGRLHDVQEARAAFDIARRSFDRVSFDLIYARQGQSLADWRQELNEALQMAVDHLSLYQLTIEDGTAFGDRYKRGRLACLPDDDLASDMYLATQDLCEAAGMPGYEISNHARAGAESRHNSLYWRYGDYVGIGPGAHGRLTLSGRRHATEAIRNPGQWLNAAEQGATETIREGISPADQGAEMLLMGLRLIEGVETHRFQRLSGRRLSQTGLATLSDMGLIETSQTHVKASAQGRLLLNRVIFDLLGEA